MVPSCVHRSMHTCGGGGHYVGLCLPAEAWLATLIFSSSALLVPPM